MTSISVNTMTLLSLLGAEAVAVMGMALFYYWAVRSVGLFHAAAKGREFSQAVTSAKEAIGHAAETAIVKIASHDGRVLELVKHVDRVADQLKQVTPASIQSMVDGAASRKAAVLTAKLLKERNDAQAEAQSLSELIQALTSAPSVLAQHVRSGLPANLDPKLVGQIIAYCGTRGIMVGQSSPSQGPRSGVARAL